MLLAISAMAALAFAALPALASATPTVDPTVAFPAAFTGTSGVSTLSSGGTSVTCQKSKSAGSFTSGTTGKIELTFEECTSFGLGCTNVAGKSNVITTTEFVFHLVYLDEAHKTVGIQVTPAANEHFATFTCAGFINIAVTGNGVLGHLSSPACGAKSKTAVIDFTATGGSQTFKKIEETGTEIDLKSSIGGGSTATQVTKQTTTLAGGAEATLTCI
jgi:hypothetical protein